MKNFRVYLDWDGVFLDQSTSIQAAYPAIPYDTYRSDLYRRFKAEKLNGYRDMYNWYVNICQPLPGAIDKLKELVNHGFFKSIHILTAKREEELPLLFMSAQKMGILDTDGDNYDDLLTNHARRYRHRGKTKELYTTTDMMPVTHYEICNDNNNFKIPITSVICVPTPDDKARFMAIRPGLLIDDNIFTIEEVSYTQGCFTHWIKHVWDKDIGFYRHKCRCGMSNSLSDLDTHLMYSRYMERGS